MEEYSGTKPNQAKLKTPALQFVSLGPWRMDPVIFKQPMLASGWGGHSRRPVGCPSAPAGLSSSSSNEQPCRLLRTVELHPVHCDERGPRGQGKDERWEFLPKPLRHGRNELDNACLPEAGREIVTQLQVLARQRVYLCIDKPPIGSGKQEVIPATAKAPPVLRSASRLQLDLVDNRTVAFPLAIFQLPTAAGGDMETLQNRAAWFLCTL